MALGPCTCWRCSLEWGLSSMASCLDFAFVVHVKRALLPLWRTGAPQNPHLPAAPEDCTLFWHTWNKKEIHLFKNLFLFACLFILYSFYCRVSSLLILFGIFNLLLILSGIFLISAIIVFFLRQVLYMFFLYFYVSINILTHWLEMQ